MNKYSDFTRTLAIISNLFLDLNWMFISYFIYAQSIFSHFLTVVNNTAVIFLYGWFVNIPFNSFGVNTWKCDHRVKWQLCVYCLEELPDCSQKSYVRVPDSPHSYLFLSIFQMMAVLVGMKWYPYDFEYTFLMASDVGRFFMCSFAIVMSFEKEKKIFHTFTCFKIRLFA